MVRVGYAVLAAVMAIGGKAVTRACAGAIK
jgi:hypothetical protein